MRKNSVIGKRYIEHAISKELDGGERGIRTLDTLPYTHFPGVLLQPLGHLTAVTEVGIVGVL